MPLESETSNRCVDNRGIYDRGLNRYSIPPIRVSRIVELAKRFSGGSYLWTSDSSGSLLEVRLAGEKKDKPGARIWWYDDEKKEWVWPKDTATYCTGFTLGIALTVAKERGLLKNKTITQVGTLGLHWNGSTKKNEAMTDDIFYKQSILAMAELGIGKEITEWNDVRAGDFVQLWWDKDKTAGHSAVFLEWKKDPKGKIVGLTYRAANAIRPKDSVGDATNYFTGDAPKGSGWTIKRNRFYVGRLNEG